MKVASHSNMNLLMQNLNREQMMKSGQDKMEESLPEGGSSSLVGAVASTMVCGEVTNQYQIFRPTPTGLP